MRLDGDTYVVSILTMWFMWNNLNVTLGANYLYLCVHYNIHVGSWQMYMPSNCNILLLMATDQLLHSIANSAPGDIYYNGKVFSNDRCWRNCILYCITCFYIHHGVNFVMHC
jgi:hypothetical protein